MDTKANSVSIFALPSNSEDKMYRGNSGDGDPTPSNNDQGTANKSFDAGNSNEQMQHPAYDHMNRNNGGFYPNQNNGGYSNDYMQNILPDSSTANPNGINPHYNQMNQHYNGFMNSNPPIGMNPNYMNPNATNSAGGNPNQMFQNFYNTATQHEMNHYLSGFHAGQMNPYFMNPQGSTETNSQMHTQRASGHDSSRSGSSMFNQLPGPAHRHPNIGSATPSSSHHGLPGDQSTSAASSSLPGQLNFDQCQSPGSSSEEPSSSTSPPTACTGQLRTNQQGGVFRNGLALNMETRQKIVELSAKGMKPSEISRMCRISHGCVSKILDRYQTYGTVEPGPVSKYIARNLNPNIKKRIQELRDADINLTPAQMREILEVDNTPDIPENNVIKMYIKILEEEENGAVASEEPMTPKYKLSRKRRRQRTIFSSFQTRLLENVYTRMEYPDVQARDTVSRQTGLDETIVHVWFSNRRARTKRKLKKHEAMLAQACCSPSAYRVPQSPSPMMPQASTPVVPSSPSMESNPMTQHGQRPFFHLPRPDDILYPTPSPNASPAEIIKEREEYYLRICNYHISAMNRSLHSNALRQNSQSPPDVKEEHDQSFSPQNNNGQNPMLQPNSYTPPNSISPPRNVSPEYMNYQEQFMQASPIASSSRAFDNGLPAFATPELAQHYQNRNWDYSYNHQFPTPNGSPDNGSPNATSSNNSSPGGSPSTGTNSSIEDNCNNGNSSYMETQEYHNQNQPRPYSEYSDPSKKPPHA